MDKKQLRASVIALHLKGKAAKEISQLLEVKHFTVHRIITRYNETGTADDRPRSGRPATVNTPKLRRALKGRIQRNNQRSMRRMAKELKTNRETVRSIVTKTFGLHPYKLLKAQLLTERQKLKRLQRSSTLLQRFRNQKHRRILFTDEKVFTIEQYHNRQNDRELLTKGSHKDPNRTRVTHTQGPASVMVWAGICATGKTPLVFIERGVKINSEVYQNMLADDVVPWAESQFGNRLWTFQQDGAPSHIAKATQDFCKEHFKDLISKDEWPPASPDLNPMDYSVWGLLEQELAGKRFQTIAALKRALQKAWDEVTTDELRKIVDNFPKRLQACIDAQGGHFEV